MNNIRSEGRINADFGVKDYYDYYKSKSKDPKSKTLFDKIIYDFNKRIVEAIINEGLEFTPVKTQFTFCIEKIKKVLNL